MRCVCVHSTHVLLLCTVLSLLGWVSLSFALSFALPFSLSIHCRRESILSCLLPLLRLADTYVLCRCACTHVHTLVCVRMVHRTISRLYTVRGWRERGRENSFARQTCTITPYSAVACYRSRARDIHTHSTASNVHRAQSTLYSSLGRRTVRS